ncbi:hypothetical protein [Pseudoxanthomonas sp.]|uniref:hypothetical protein n=1 Tax=Pseudoxanthomonas sp. TaxID=1871049 RepID=UPI002584275F|nr:hypothetical protein [Pseudoxanthomonas sp.]MCR6686864.1 hypothetical protein [Pseudoxanthomonas sp.]
MTRAAEIVAALNARSGARMLVERATGLPYGWALWMKSLPRLPARPHARAAEIETLLVQRGPVTPVRGEELSPTQAFLALFRQSWWPAPREERPVRWVSRLGTFILHLLFLALLAWMAWMQSLPPPDPPEAGGGGERIGIGFVGRGDPGTPAASGDPSAAATADEAAAQAAAVAEPSAPASSATAPAEAVAEELAAPAVTMPELPATVPVMPEPVEAQVAEREVPQPVERPVEPPAVEQPVQVTEVEQPTIDYVLPPPTPREVQPRRPAELQVRPREVAVVEAPAVPLPRAREIDVAVPRPTEPQLRQREVDEPLSELRHATAVRAPVVDAQLRRTPEGNVRQREVAMPSPAPSPVPAAAAASPSSASAGDPRAAAPAGSPGTAARESRAPGAATAAAAARPAPGGGWERALSGDDWGQAREGQARPGGSAPGLFDGQGRVRLPGQGDGPGQGEGRGPGQGPGEGPGEGVADRGAPGGDNDSWTRERFDQAGTWLKRPPRDYQGTSFDRYWVPNESLLAEWVRKGIQSVAIPIPGGNGRKLNCVVSLLQLGGGCGISNDNMNEQPAQARPPPDIPFKQELQEDNGSAPAPQDGG